MRPASKFWRDILLWSWRSLFLHIRQISQIAAKAPTQLNAHSINIKSLILVNIKSQQNSIGSVHDLNWNFIWMVWKKQAIMSQGLALFFLERHLVNNSLPLSQFLAETTCTICAASLPLVQWHWSTRGCEVPVLRKDSGLFSPCMGNSSWIFCSHAYLKSDYPPNRVWKLLQIARRITPEINHGNVNCHCWTYSAKF